MLSARRSVGKLSRLGEFRHVSTGLRSGEILIESRVFSKDDVHRFVKLSLDENKIHTDDDIAQKFGFRRAIVPGILSASLFPAAISKKFPGAVYMSQTLKFRHPALVCMHFICDSLLVDLQMRANLCCSCTGGLA